MTLALLGAPAFAKPYYVSPMTCQGKITGNYEKQGIQSDYYTTTIKVNSFRVTKKTGEVVDSNRVDISSSATLYRGALFVTDNSVNMAGADAYGGDLALKIVSKGQSEGQPVDYLEGTLGANNSWGYTLKCTAKVIDDPKTRDDRR